MASQVLHLLALLLLSLLLTHGYSKPNIVVLLTDDQDLTLGGMTPLPFLKELMQKKGASLTNFFVNTPVCCPSRTTLLSGMYPHNWHTTNGGCMHMNVTNPQFEESTIGVQMKKLQYRTGMFGKYLNPPGVSPYCNKDEEKNIQLPGFDDYLAMCNDNRYFKNTFAGTDKKVHTSGDKPQDYLTSIIGNYTVKFIDNALSNGEPFFVYVAPHAPHVPSTPAPWYMNEFANLSAPRTPNYNYGALDHHYVIRSQAALTEKIAGETDELFRNRWRSLLSVDDIVKEVVATLDKHGQLENTYIIHTSDHGFNLGQFRLPSCKLQPYDNDIRVPFNIYGPNIEAGSKHDFVAGMVDVAPTIVALGEGAVRESMDGLSFANLIVKEDVSKAHTVGKADMRRDIHMIEYWSLGNVIRFEHYIDMPNNTYIGARLINSTHNYLYAEFYNGENVVSFDKPLEYELFNLNADPYEMKNLFSDGSATDNAVKEELQQFIHRQIQCAGKSCYSP